LRGAPPPRGGGRGEERRRWNDDEPLAYATLETVQRMGGSSHSDMRLTTRVYTDATALPTRDAIQSLPLLLTPSQGGETSLQASLPDALFPVAGSPDVSRPVAESEEYCTRNSFTTRLLGVPSCELSRPFACIATDNLPRFLVSNVQYLRAHSSRLSQISSSRNCESAISR